MKIKLITETICYVQPSQQQKRIYLWMRIGPTLINNKWIFQKRIIDAKILLDITFNLVIDSKKRSKTDYTQFPPFEDCTWEKGHDGIKYYHQWNRWLSETWYHTIKKKERTTLNRDETKKYKITSLIHLIMIWTKLMNHEKKKYLMFKQ